MLGRLKDAYYRFRTDCAEKLVMTLLVKNEADIILDNILFHLSMGVDFIIVTDNGSTDGTLEILKDLQTRGMILLLQEEGYLQEKWVNRMGRLAKEHYGATLLIHADADEFWTPLGAQSLKEAFMRNGQDLIAVRSRTVLPAREVFKESFPQRSMYKIKKPLAVPDLESASQTKSWFILEHYPKIMLALRGGYRDVDKGNHHLVGEYFPAYYADNIVIHHFSIKSYSRFLEKVKNGGEAYKKNSHYSREVGWHWKRWYQLFNEGRFDEMIDQLVPPQIDRIEEIQVRPFDYEKEIRAVRRPECIRPWLEPSAWLSPELRVNAADLMTSP